LGFFRYRGRQEDITMGEQGTNRQRPPTRIIRHERPAAPPLRVTDPAIRALLKELRRARSMELAALNRYLGPDEPPHDAAA